MSWYTKTRMDLVLMSIILRVSIVLLLLAVVTVRSEDTDDKVVAVDPTMILLEQRLQAAKLEIWARNGAASALLDEIYWFGDDLHDQVAGMEAWRQFATRHGPIQNARSATYQQSQWRQRAKTRLAPYAVENQVQGLSVMRGGESAHDTSISSMSSAIDLESNLVRLIERFGSAFAQAVELNKQEHDKDCQESCEYYYCGSSLVDVDDSNITSTLNYPALGILGNDNTTVRSYSMGAVPPEDFADDFGFPLDLIKVTQGHPLFSKLEAAKVIDVAEHEEHLSNNEFVSGKYKLAGDWLTALPKTRQWLNHKLETTLFPLLAHLFPEIVSHPSVLRAHSVSLLKYNATHPRTDVHVDNGILAITLAMNPLEEYQGGGTFFEHFAESSNGNNDVDNVADRDKVIHMDVGHGTFRPGSVRHGGQRVTKGTRYILGAFLLIQDRVEHVRRLKNRGSDLRRAGNLVSAAQHFEWALALNPKCTTCLKDWAEVLHRQQQFEAAEAKIRQALELLEYKDSDAWFMLGLLLSEQGRDVECIDAYRQSLALNAEDAELLYNLGVKIGEDSNASPQEEIEMYKRCTEVDPSFGGAWLNLGTVLAENGNLADSETMFQKALSCNNPLEVKPKAMINLALIYHHKVGRAFQQQNIEAARSLTLQAVEYLDAAKPLLDRIATQTDDLSTSGRRNCNTSSIGRYQSQYTKLRLACHRNLGQIYAGTGNLELCEEEFRRATVSFPTEIQAWQMLGRVLEMQGKKDAMHQVAATIQRLQELTSNSP